MKATVVALAAVAVLTLTLTASASSNPPGCDLGTSEAQSCTASHAETVYVNGFGSAFIPCLNHGQGENVVFSGTKQTLFFYTVTEGKRNGFSLFTGGALGLTGRGQTTGLRYRAWGTEDYAFENWVPYNPDGTFDGEGSFSITDDWHIRSSRGEIHIWHRRVRFQDFKDGDVYTSQGQPDEVACQ